MIRPVVTPATLRATQAPQAADLPCFDALPIGFRAKAKTEWAMANHKDFYRKGYCSNGDDWRRDVPPPSEAVEGSPMLLAWEIGRADGARVMGCRT